MKLRLLVAALALLLLTQVTPAQMTFTKAFPPEEFATRRSKVMDQIGPDAIAVIRGAGDSPVYVKFRQNSQFFYLTGVQFPNAMLLLDGKTKQATLFLAPKDERVERMDGPGLYPGDEAAKLSGIATVLSTDRFSETLTKVAGERKTIYAPFRRESLNSAAPEVTVGHMADTLDDPWDGRPSREGAFVEKLRSRFPQVELRDLDRMLDLMRVVKSPREIENLRQANRLAARAMIEMIKATAPGMHEYEVEAVGHFIFHLADAQQGYYAQAYANNKTTRKPGRYHMNEGEIRDGDMLTMDFGPDYNNYVADIMRVWPASGKYTPAEREGTTIFLRYWKDLEDTIRPGVPPGQIVREAGAKMEKDAASFTFTNAKVHDAAVALAQRMKTQTRNYFGHFVGLDVHDVETLEMGTPPIDVLKPGMVFSIEFGLSLNVPDEGFNAHMEDNYVVTQTGVEDLTASLPRDPDAIEKLMAEGSPLKVMMKKTAQ